MHRLTPWRAFLFLALLASPLTQAAPSPARSPASSNVAAGSRGLTATATATRPVVVGQGSSTSAPSLAPGGLFLNVVIGSTLVNSTTTSALLTVSAVCEGTAIEPLHIPPLQVNVPLPGARTTASPLTMEVELPWDGGRRELADADYYADRSYTCTATAQLTATSSRRTKSATATAAATYWDVLLAVQAATIPTTEPSNGDEVNSASFMVTSFDDPSTSVPVAIGISPGTVQTTEGQSAPPDGSDVVITVSEPETIPPGLSTPLFASQVVELGLENTVFSEPVIIGLLPSGPFADADDPIPLTYREEEYIQEWVHCEDDGSCLPIPCPIASSFEPGMVCFEVTHFSLWALGSDKRVVMQVELMNGDGKTPANFWKCGTGAPCPTGMQGRYAYTHPADTTSRKARIRVCTQKGEFNSCDNGEMLIKGLTSWSSPSCFAGGSCSFTGGKVSESPINSGYYYVTLYDLTTPGWGSLQISVSVEDITRIPDATADMIAPTNCSGDGQYNNMPMMHECLSLAVSPRIDEASWNGGTKTLSATSAMEFESGASPAQNLEAGTVTLYFVEEDQCDQTTWNVSRATPVTVTPVSAGQVGGASETLVKGKVRTQTVNGAYGTVLGPCVSVTSLDTDGDNFTEAQGDCNDSDPTVHPTALEYPGNGKDDDCDGVESAVVQVAGGFAHTVALDDQGRVWAWGDNWYGQLGDGTTAQRTSPVQVPGLSGVKSVAGGWFHSLAVDDQGRVWAWGYNKYGQLGDGTTADRTSPAQVPGPTGVKSVEGGGNYSLALDDQGRVWAWGYNHFGQLGDGTTVDRTSPVQVPGLLGVQSVAGGGNHSLAVDDQGRVWAWGYNKYGQLGDETNTQRNSPVQMPDLNGVKAAAAGLFHSLALDDQGRVWAWGDNSFGQLGDGTTTGRTSPVLVPGLSGMKGVVGGSYHTLALDDQGKGWAWGYNLYGQLGDATRSNRSSPGQVPGLNGIVAAAGGSRHTLALDNQGRVWAWGYNGNGQLGDGTTSSRNSPVQVPILSGVKSMAGGSSHTLAVDDQGRVWAWGYNGSGQLGDGTTTNRASPVQVPGLSGMTSVVGGADYSLALDDQGRVWAWGANAYGQLGDGTTTSRLSPVQVPGLSKVVDVVGQYSHSLALDDQGRVWVWGSNDFGQLGDRTTTDSTSPLQVPDLSGVVAVAGGGAHSLALDDQGRVWAWGYNGYGQLGDGTTTDRTRPIQVTGLSGVISVAGGGTHSLAVGEEGQVWTWGFNWYGSLGEGTTTDSTSPLQVPDLSGVVAVAGGGSHSLALDDQGQVWTWGRNFEGQLGDGTTTNSSSPRQVPGLSGVVAVAGGQFHSLLIHPDLTLAACGSNALGELGIVISDTWSPQPVVWGP